MASNTASLVHKRKRRDRKAGKARKRILRREGSTPTFPIHKEEKAGS